MKERILLISFILFSAIWINGQATYLKTVGGPGYEMVRTAIETNDGNYLLVGNSVSDSGQSADIFVSKMNGASKVIWDKALRNDVNQNIIGATQLSNGDFILVGWVSDGTSYEEDILIIRMNSFGGILWTKEYEYPGSQEALKVIQCTDGNILVGAFSQIGVSNEFDYILLKLNLDGDEIWSKFIDTESTSQVDPELEIAEVGQNSIALFGTDTHDPIPGSHGSMYLFDQQGSLIESNAYTESNFISFNHVVSLQAVGSDVFGEVDNNNGEREILFSHFDQNGDVTFSKSFRIPDRYLHVHGVSQKDNGNYLLTGEIFKSNPNTTILGLFMEIDQNGDLVWAKSYSGEYDHLNAGFETTNGHIAFGSTLDQGADLYDILAISTNDVGSISGCSQNVVFEERSYVLGKEPISIAVSDFISGESIFTNKFDLEFVENVVCDGCSSNDLEAGLFCETAPIICSIDCLDGFTATLPDSLIMPQPDPLCDGGIPNNVSWFAFVAGSNTVDLSIIPSNCTTIFDETGTEPQTIGIQAGVYADCNFEESFICATDGCLDLVAETINISSNEFVIGQTYYLFVDGCGGSVCDYEVVVNSAEQAFEMPEFTTISNNLNVDLEEDTLCQGTTITFTLDDFDLPVNFNWSIDPPTPLYPSGVHPVIDTSSVSFQFTEEGCFDIHVYAFNDCDNTETRTFSVCVEALEDEVFSDIYVCQECFPITLVSPDSGCIITEGGVPPTVLTEDPNGDGVPGWLGTSTIMGPGLDSNLVTNTFGCTYTQYVNVIEIPLSPREQIDHYFCLTDFPVVIDGVTFNSPGDSRNITLDGQAASGCDSLINITAYAIDLIGSSSIGNCESGEVELAFEISSVIPEDYDSIIYEWFDENGDPVTDTDGIDSILLVTGVGSFSVQVTVTAENVSCSQTYGPYMVDVDNLAPDTPTITYAPNSICASENIAQIYVSDQGLSEEYTWTLTPNLPFSFGLTTDTIFVEINTGEDFQFCVIAENGCGTSSEICDDVIVNVSPDSEFSYTSEVCLDSFVLVEYTGTFGTLSSSIFNWDFDGGTILNGADPNSAGPFQIGFASSGTYTIGLILNEAGCSSVLTSHEVVVADPFDAPMIICDSESGMITFSWDGTGVTSVDVNIISGQSTFTLDGNSLIIEELSSEEDVEVQFLFNGGDICGGTLVSESCTSEPCPSVSLEASLSENELCFSGEGDNIQLSILITGDNSGNGNWESPFLVNEDEFDVNAAGIGEFPISYSYQINNCTYSIDTVIRVYSIPSVEVSINPSLCEAMGSTTVDILTDSTNVVLLDGEEIENLDLVNVDPGMHEITSINTDGCSMTFDFEVMEEGIEALQVLGETAIIEGQSESYFLDFTSTIDDVVISWTFEGDTICEDCTTVDLMPEEDGVLCVHLSYGEGCESTECIEILVNERTKLFIPNIFSPNNDNINDVFKINSNNSTAFIVQIMIFDRWGEKVFEQQGASVGEEAMFWDGNFNGSMCNPGVYVYIIDYLDDENRPQKITGDLTLVR